MQCRQAVRCTAVPVIKAVCEGLSLDSSNGIISAVLFDTARRVTGQEKYQSQEERKEKKFKPDRQLVRLLRAAKRRAKWRNSKGPREIRRLRKAIWKDLESKRLKDSARIHYKLISEERNKSSQVFKTVRKLRQADTQENKLPSRIQGYGKTFTTPNVLDGLRILFQEQTTIDFRTGLMRSGLT